MALGLEKVNAKLTFAVGELGANASVSAMLLDAGALGPLVGAGAPSGVGWSGPCQKSGTNIFCRSFSFLCAYSPI
jgi:hypothetical protein